MDAFSFQGRRRLHDARLSFFWRIQPPRVVVVGGGNTTRRCKLSGAEDGALRCNLREDVDSFHDFYGDQGGGGGRRQDHRRKGVKTEGGNVLSSETQDDWGHLRHFGLKGVPLAYDGW